MKRGKCGSCAEPLYGTSMFVTSSCWQFREAALQRSTAALSASSLFLHSPLPHPMPLLPFLVLHIVTVGFKHAGRCMPSHPLPPLLPSLPLPCPAPLPPPPPQPFPPSTHPPHTPDRDRRLQAHRQVHTFRTFSTPLPLTRTPIPFPPPLTPLTPSPDPPPHI